MPPSVPSSAGPAPSAPHAMLVRVFVSPDPFLRQEARERAVSAWRQSGESSVLRIDLSERPLAEALTTAASCSLFAPRQVLVLERLESLSAKEHGPLLAYFDAPNPKTLLLITAEKLDGRSKLAQSLQKRRWLEVLSPPAAHELVGVIEQRAATLGVTLTRRGAQALAERVGADVGLLHESLQKVALFAARPGEPGRPQAIDAEEIYQVVAPTREASIFVLTEALGEGARAKASRALAELLQGGEEPLVILAMLIRQVRLLLAAQGDGRVLGVPPFVARTLMRQAKSLSRDTLLGALGDLQACDLALKRSGLPPALALERAIGPLLTAASRGAR